VQNRMGKKVKRNTLSGVMPVLVVALLGYILLAGTGLLSIVGLSATTGLFTGVPGSDATPSGRAFVDSSIEVISDNQVKVDVNAYTDITRWAGRTTTTCDSDSACVFAEDVGSGNLVKVFVVDVDNSTYLDTVVFDEGVLTNGKPLGLFAWDGTANYMVSTTDVQTTEGKAVMGAYEKCEGFEEYYDTCWRLVLADASKTISLPEGNFVVEVRALNIRDLKMVQIGDVDNILRRDPEYLQSYLDRNYPFNSSYYQQGKYDLGDSDYLNVQANNLLTQVYLNDEGTVYGVFRESDFANAFSREEMFLVDSLVVNVAVSDEPPIVPPVIPPEEPPETQPGLLDWFFVWLNGVWKAFIGLFYV